MREVCFKITLTVTDETDIEFLVTPGNALHFQQLAVALSQLGGTIYANSRSLSTLAETVTSIAEFGGGAKAASHTLKAITPLLERNRIAGEQIEFVRLLLAKSVQQQPDELDSNEGRTLQ